MRLGWAKTKYSISYCVKKTIYVNGKNKDLVIKRLDSEKYICETLKSTQFNGKIDKSISRNMNVSVHLL